MYTNIEEKIRKLLALGERAGTEAEAEAAMNAAYRLLAEHNLDMDQIQANGLEKAEDLIIDDSTPSDLRNTSQLILFIAQLQECIFVKHFLELAPVRTYARSALLGNHQTSQL